VAKKPAGKKKAGKPLAQRLAASPALVKKYQSDPGLRAKYLTGSLEKYLTPAQRQSRAVNVRLKAPIAPGSSVTERDLAHEAQAATTVRYGPQDRALAQQLGVAQQTQLDTASAYDQYRQALQQHAAQVQAYQQGAQQALAQTQAGITGLGSQEALQLQTQANQAAAQQGVAPAGDLSALANAAMATRQGVMGTFQGEQALQGAATNNYADAQANVVAPAQKLSALAQAAGRTRDARQRQTDLATEKGAFNQQFRDTRRQDELKNQLAMSTLNINATKAATDAATKTPEAQAAVAGAKTSATTAAKYGYTAHQWALLGPKGRQRVINASKAQGGSKPDMGKVNQYGYTEEQWRAKSVSERQRIIKDFKAKTGGGSSSASATTDKKAFRDKYGVDLQPTSAHNRARDAVQNAQAAFGQVGKVTKRKDGSRKRVTTDEVVSVLRNQGVSNLWIRAGLEMARGGLTPGTAARIHKAGYSVAELGYKMRPAPTGAAGYNKGNQPG